MKCRKENAFFVEVRQNFAREIANKVYGEEGFKTERKDEVLAGSAPPPSSGVSLAAAESGASAAGDRTRLASSVPPFERPGWTTRHILHYFGNQLTNLFSVTPTAPLEEQSLSTALKEVMSDSLYLLEMPKQHIMV